ncbi:60s ribosomal protein l6-1 [Lasiodiplodia theobromae]|uniref:60s ribosomal protein l6-1 n=1 Tax=Lasiodiplodia theobromae TaxID=45133 RepID=UPI0015C2FA2C|nr:60s ribosomal protein l6-1 [Lasiodiplodia theobromae]KAF4540878.1 60s ribosomal protein l6-1 [Lasiodiplodia theobromae]
MITSQFARIRATTRLHAVRLPGIRSPCANKLSGLRLSSNAAKQAAPKAAPAAPKDFVAKSASTKKLLFPERLLIYNAGTGKTTWVAFTKLGTIVLFAFGCLVIAPRLHYHPDTPWWAAPAAILLAPVPLLLTTALTSPFVNSIYLHLPLYARQSRQLLHRFAASPPADALLDVRTVRLNGFWKTTGTAVGELRPLPPRGFLGGLANVERVPRVAVEKKKKDAGKGGKEGEEKKKLWDVDGDKRGLLQRFAALFVEPRRRFYINPAEGSRRSAEPGVIELIMKAVEKQHS